MVAISLRLPYHPTPPYIHPSIRNARVVYLQCLQHKLCELNPSKYNITSHKKFSCNVVKCWKTFSYFSKLIFLGLEIHFCGPCADTLAHIREESGEATRSELPQVFGNFHFVLLTSRDNLYFWEAGYGTIKLKYFSFLKTLLWSLHEKQGSYLYLQKISNKRFNSDANISHVNDEKLI